MYLLSLMSAEKAADSWWTHPYTRHIQHVSLILSLWFQSCLMRHILFLVTVLLFSHQPVWSATSSVPKALWNLPLNWNIWWIHERHFLLLYASVCFPNPGSRCDPVTSEGSSVQTLTAPPGVSSNTWSKINTRLFLIGLLFCVRRERH